MPARRPAWTAGFLSTPSARRATCRTPPGTSSTTNFYPRPPRGGRLMRWKSGAGPSNFYPRPPRGGRPCRRPPDTTAVHDFYPRPPRGGRHNYREALHLLQEISIHALREEGDPFTTASAAFCLHFYPRPPRGGRRYMAQLAAEYIRISIHALREEGDGCNPRCLQPAADFYPRPPRGGRHKDGTMTIMASKFLSTPSARRATNAESAM